jgi:hypothetical protein
MMEKIGLEGVFDNTNFNAGITKYQNSVDTASTKTGKLSGVMNAIGGAAKIGIAGVIGLAGAAVGAAAGLTKLVMKATDTASNLVAMSDKSGIGVERLQELQYIGNQTGTSIDTMVGSITRLKRSMGDVATSEAMAANFDKLGVAVYNADGTLRDSELVFNDLIGALGAVSNETERDAIAMEIFGRSATELNPLILAGKDGMAAMTEEARNMGAVMSEEAVYGLEGFGDSIDSLKAAFGGIIGQVATAVLPIFTELTEKLVAFVQSPEFQEGIENLSKWLGENIPKVLQFLSDTWTNVLQPAVETVWSWMSGTLIPFFQNEIVPILKVVIPGAIDILRGAWENVLLPAITTIWEFLSVTMMPIWEKIGEFLGVLLPIQIGILQGAWENVLKPALEAIWNFISTYILPVFQALSDRIGGISGVIEAVVGWIDKMITNLSNLELPDWLTPGSPTPFEIGLRGIAKALKDVNGMTASINLVPNQLAYAAAGISPTMSNYPVSNSRVSNISINMGGVNISNGMDESSFISRIEYAVGRALGV